MFTFESFTGGKTYFSSLNWNGVAAVQAAAHLTTHLVVWVQIPVITLKTFLWCFHSWRPEIHSATYQMNSVFFVLPWQLGKWRRLPKGLTTSHFVPLVGISGALPPYSLCAVHGGCSSHRGYFLPLPSKLKTSFSAFCYKRVVQTLRKHLFVIVDPLLPFESKIKQISYPQYIDAQQK